jgi:hypothetical protein
VAIPVLLILAVLWAAVLVPPVLRSRSESRRGGLDDYTSRLGALMDRHASSRSVSRQGGPARLRTLYPASSATRSPSAARSRRNRATVQRRRRNVLVVLIGSAVLTFALALAINPLLWIPHVAADVLLAAYLFLLFLMTRHASPAVGDDEFWSSTPGTRTTGAAARPRVPRPEVARMPGDSTPRRSAAS